MTTQPEPLGPRLSELLYSVPHASKARRDFDFIAHTFVDLVSYLSSVPENPEAHEQKAAELHSRVVEGVQCVTKYYEELSFLYQGAANDPKNANGKSS